jgi:hypothetical protein
MVIISLTWKAELSWPKSEPLNRQILTLWHHMEITMIILPSWMRTGYVLLILKKFTLIYKIILQSHEDDLLQQEEGVLYIGIDGNLESEAGPSEYSKNILEEGK